MSDRAAPIVTWTAPLLVAVALRITGAFVRRAPFPEDVAA